MEGEQPGDKFTNWSGKIPNITLTIKRENRQQLCGPVQNTKSVIVRPRPHIFFFCKLSHHKIHAERLIKKFIDIGLTF